MTELQNDRMTDRTKTICPPIFDLRGIKSLDDIKILQIADYFKFLLSIAIYTIIYSYIIHSASIYIWSSLLAKGYNMLFPSFLKEEAQLHNYTIDLCLSIYNDFKKDCNVSKRL